VNIKKMLACALAAVTLAGGASLAVAAPASAHTPEASATCSTLTVALANYSVAPDGSFINTVSVEIDSTVVDDEEFGTSMRETYPLGDSAVAHDYLVEVDASGTQYDREFAGTTVPCKREVAPDASAVLSVAPATCDTNGTLTLGDVKNATWGTPTTAVGPGQYAVTATAVAGHVFADGTTGKSFAGTLDGRLDPDVAPCAAIVVVPDRPAPTRDVVDTTALDCFAGTQTTTTTTTTTDWTLDTASNTWVTAPPVVTVTTATVNAVSGVCGTTATPPTVVTPPTGVTPPAVTPPADVTPPAPPVTTVERSVPVQAVPVRALAHTGSDAGAVAPIGAGILLFGVALMLVQRLRSKRAAQQ
jgi:hypothetical protein